jgi:LmbE family N-acetylglucosaminyl deacetylase
MGTIVCFHAHPDDESIATAGTMARAAAAGHRVVLVVATRGEHGEPVPGVLDDGEQLTLRRSAETQASADALGAQRVEFLGYVDSGMMGEPTNDVPWSFWQADVDQAARRLAAILSEEQPDVLTTYDDNGGYGHPDHIQVHRVGRRAAELAGVPVVAQWTINRDRLRRQMALMSEAADAPENFEAPDVSESSTFGKPEAEITHEVDVTSAIDSKRQSMLAHRSQMSDEHFLLAMSPEVFQLAMGSESYIVEGTASGTGLFAELFDPTR